MIRPDKVFIPILSSISPNTCLIVHSPPTLTLIFSYPSHLSLIKIVIVSGSVVDSGNSDDTHLDTHAPPLSLPLAFLLQHPSLLHLALAAPLYKQRSCSSDAFCDEAWLWRKGNWKNRHSKSVTDEDVDELKACIELGFRFESPPKMELDQHFSDTLPVLGLYCAANKTNNDSLFPKPAAASMPSSSAASDCDNIVSPRRSPHTTIFNSGNNPQTVKTRLRQWAQVVATMESLRYGQPSAYGCSGEDIIQCG